MRRKLPPIPLKPCPLCRVDGEQELTILVSCDPSNLNEEQADGAWAVYCGNCGLTLPGFDDRQDAARRWNERPGEAES
jgi:hypothetical protein